MDLGAYGQIANLTQIAEANGIDIPRLRGYRLMKYEEPVTKEDMAGMVNEAEIARRLCRSRPFWNPNASVAAYDSYTDWVCRLYVKGDPDDCFAGEVRWDKIHGKKRKILKFEIKQKKRAIQKQYELWNKYCGREDVLYIHSRMGGNNWKWFEGKVELMNQPWFLDRVDDHWDSTYCDFYAKLNDETIKIIRELGLEKE